MSKETYKTKYSIDKCMFSEKQGILVGKRVEIEVMFKKGTLTSEVAKLSIYKDGGLVSVIHLGNLKKIK